MLQGLQPKGDGWSGTVYIPSMGEAFPMALTAEGARTLRFTLWLKPSEPHTVTLVRAE